MTTNMDFKLNRRDTSIDILRFIAISGIILAHSMIYILGMNIKKFSLNQLWILAIIASIVFITLYIYITGIRLTE